MGAARHPSHPLDSRIRSSYIRAIHHIDNSRSDAVVKTRNLVLTATLEAIVPSSSSIMMSVFAYTQPRQNIPVRRRSPSPSWSRINLVF